MGIATREVMIAAHELAIKQLEEMTPNAYVEGSVNFKMYQEALQVREVVVDYLATGQRNASKISVRVGKITERPTNKSGTTLSLPYNDTFFRSGQGHSEEQPPEAILLVQEHHGDHKAWIRLQGREDWKMCNGMADSWFFA